MISVGRLGVLVTLTVYHFKHASVNDTIEVGKFLRVFSVAGQVCEHFALIYGICRLTIYVHQHRNDSTKRLDEIFSYRKTKDHFHYLWKKYKSPCLADSPSKSCVAITCTVTVICTMIIFIVYGSISFTPGILLIIWKEKLVISYHDHTGMAIAYAVAAGISFISNFFARIAMIVTTLAVGNAWINKINSDKETKDQSQIKDLINGYKETGQAVAAIQRVFQDWFVVKWIVYFIDITVDSIIAIKSVFGNEQQQDHEIIIYFFIHLTYNFVAFLTLYMCGTIMNRYHENYCKKLEKKIRTEFEETEQHSAWKIQCAIASLRKPKYQFTPSLCGFSIPLDNSGYTLSILIALFAFIANYVSTL